MKETVTAYVECLPPDVLHVRMKDLGAEIPTADYLDLLNVCKDMMGERKHFLMLDTRNVHVNFGPEVRALKAENPYLNKYRVGEAYLINSLPMRLIANVYLAVNKPKVPIRYFQTENEALKWFEKLRTGNGNGHSNGVTESPVLVSL